MADTQRFNRFPRARGKRHTPGTMNQLEDAYSKVLEDRRIKGEISGWWFESVKLVLADRCSYTPDFLVMDNDGYLEFHECKGFPTDDWKVKWKVSIQQFPMFTFVLVSKKNKKSDWVIEVAA